MAKKVDTIEDLFRWNPPRPVADTSRRAFDKQKEKITRKCTSILDFIRDQGNRGVTLDETCVELGMLVQTGSARFRELVQSQQIEDSGERRPTRTGSPARVYKIKPNLTFTQQVRTSL